MSGITLDSVTKIYPNGVKAVDAVDLEIRDFTSPALEPWLATR